MATSTFLTAEWRKLAMANYAVDPQLLLPFLPAGTELDTWNGVHYLSLVGFMFRNTKLKGIPVPFHTNFEEVNLRFYVRHLENGTWRRGVVFIREFVPRPALTFVARTVYKEPYETLPMDHSWREGKDDLEVEYRWKKGGWNSFRVLTSSIPVGIGEGSEEEFITEHYWGYTRITPTVTSQYEVMHPRWEVYPVRDHAINVDFGTVYGAPFAFLSGEKPRSVLLAEGSRIAVLAGSKVRV